VTAAREASDPGAEVVTLGEAFIGLVAGGGRSLADAETFRRYVIGSEANTAVGLARLGRRVAFVGRVGADGLGTAILRRLRGEGVDVAHVTVDPEGATGLMLRERRELGASEAVYHRRGSAGSRLTAKDVEAAASAIRGATWLHVTGITPALSDTAREAHARAIAIASDAGVPISFGVNLRRLLWSDHEAAAVLGPLARRATLIVGSPDELATVAGTEADATGSLAAAALLAAGTTTVVATLGAGGTVLHDRTGAGLALDALSIPRVVDPVGAGDAFVAGFLAARLEGLDDPLALRWAVACGAAAVTVEGDMDGLPDRAGLERLVGGEARDILR
jgi:2-dehydro-3-deoxygluconokinase